MGPEWPPFKAVFAKQSVSAQDPSASNAFRWVYYNMKEWVVKEGDERDEEKRREEEGHDAPFFLIFLQLSSCSLFPLYLQWVLAGALALTFSPYGTYSLKTVKYTVV